MASARRHVCLFVGSPASRWKLVALIESLVYRARRFTYAAERGSLESFCRSKSPARRRFLPRDIAVQRDRPPRRCTASDVIFFPSVERLSLANFFPPLKCFSLLRHRELLRRRLVYRTRMVDTRRTGAWKSRSSAGRHFAVIPDELTETFRLRLARNWLRGEHGTSVVRFRRGDPDE